MKFFIPHAENDEQAENVLSAICQFVASPIPQKRVQMIRFTHNGEEYVVEVGKPAPPYYRTGAEEVIGIIPDNPYKVCLPNRGVIRGEPILVGEGNILAIRHFD